MQLDAASPNASNGTINNIEYFQSPNNKAYFVQSNDLFDQDGKIEEKTQPLTEYPKIGDKIETIEGHIGTVR